MLSQVVCWIAKCDSRTLVTLDLENRILKRRGAILNLPEEYVNALIVLIRERPKAVSVQELSGVLGGVESSVPKQIQRLCEGLEDTAERPQFIKTEPKRGYRFIATPVAEAEPPKSRGVPFQVGPPEPQKTSWPPINTGLWIQVPDLRNIVRDWDGPQNAAEDKLIRRASRVIFETELDEMADDSQQGKRRIVTMLAIRGLLAAIREARGASC